MSDVFSPFSAPTSAHGPRKSRNRGMMDVRIRHDAKIEVITVYYEEWRKGPHVEIMTPKQLEGHRLVLGCLYNVSGYYNPNQPKVTIKVLEGILEEGELCNCADCVEQP